MVQTSAEYCRYSKYCNNYDDVEFKCNISAGKSYGIDVTRRCWALKFSGLIKLGEKPWEKS